MIMRRKKKKISKNFILDWLLGGLFRNILTIKTRASDDTAKVAHIKKIWFAFWISYKEVAGTALIFRFKNLMNIGAIGLLIGALAGVYLRGLFFNYNMIWQRCSRSTTR